MVDPGSKTSAMKLVKVWDIPVEKIKGPNGRSDRNEISLYRLALSVDEYANEIGLAVVEEVGVMTGTEGRVGMFRFGYGAGAIAGILASLLIPTRLVKPQVWKPLMGLSRDKGISRKKATELFPDQSEMFKRVKDDGRAEAALLAVFGKRLVG